LPIHPKNVVAHQKSEQSPAKDIVNFGDANNANEAVISPHSHPFHSPFGQTIRAEDFTQKEPNRKCSQGNDFGRWGWPMDLAIIILLFSQKDTEVFLPLHSPLLDPSVADEQQQNEEMPLVNPSISHRLANAEAKFVARQLAEAAGLEEVQIKKIHLIVL
jgi:hypothetical protein